MMNTRWVWLAAVAVLAGPLAANGQEREVPPPRTLAEAGLVVDEAADSAGVLRISARVVDGATGETLETVEVDGQRDEVYVLLVRLASQMLAAGAEDPEAEVRALFALGQMLESQGRKDLAADAYQSVLKTDPEMKEARDAWERLVGQWELNAFVGLLNDEPEFQAGVGDDAFRRDAIFGLRAAYHFPFRMFVQGEVANTLVAYSVGGLRQNLNGFPLLGAVGYNFIRSHDFHLFVSAGGGAVIWNPDATSGEVDLDLNGGLGSRLFLTRNHVVRSDLRLHRVGNALSGTHRDLNFVGDSTLWGLELSVGVSWFPSGG